MDIPPPYNEEKIRVEAKPEKVKILMTATGCSVEAALLGLKDGKSKSSYAKRSKRRKSSVDLCCWKLITEEAVNASLSAGGVVQQHKSADDFRRLLLFP